MKNRGDKRREAMVNIDEYEADLVTEDEDETDGGRMAWEAQRIMDEQRAAELAAIPDTSETLTLDVRAADAIGE